jgi:iron complex outermembrane receptor protein
MKSRVSTTWSICKKELLTATALTALAGMWPASGAFAQAAGAASNSGPIALPPVDVTAPEQGPASPEQAAPPPVTPAETGGGRFTGYSVPDAFSATKTETPILQTPVSIQVVPLETINDQQRITVQDAIIGNVSSVAPAPNGFPSTTNFTIRGFNTSSNVYQNGLLLPYTQNIDTSNIQSIEVLKGPAAVLFGRVAPGGLVDIELKRPLDVPYYSFQEQAGSFGLTRTTIDATGPLTADKTWLYRINADFMHTNSFVDFVNDQDIFVAPTITYHPIEQFRLNIDAEYQHVTSVDNQPQFPAVGNAPAPIPISRYLEDPAVTTLYPDQFIRRYAGFDWKFDITNNWNLVSRFAYDNMQTFNSQFYWNCITTFAPYPGCKAPNNTFGVGANNFQFGPGHQRSISGNVELHGKFETGPLNHAVLFGMDTLNSTKAFNNIYDTNAQSLNIFDPVYNGPSLASLYKPQNGFALINTQEWKGAYVQDMISALNDSVHLLIGGRYDWAETGSGVAFGSANAMGLANQKFTTLPDRGFSPRIGLLYQPVPWLSFYGNYTQSLGFNNGAGANGQPLAPQHGIQWEGGAKAEFFDKRLSATMAFYDILETNVPTVIPGSVLSNLIGLAESKGVELDINGRIDANWSVIANFSFDDARVKQGSPFNPADPLDLVNEKPVTGNLLQGVPEYMGNLWVKYDAAGEYRGLSTAAGVSRIGEAQGDPANSFQMPAYTLLRGMAAYRFPYAGSFITAQLNIDNALNSTYFYGSTTYVNRFSLTPGVPRSFRGSLRLEF